MLPLPTAEHSPSPRPLAVLVLAAAMALLTTALWVLPDADLRQSRQALDDYATANLLETLPDSCGSWLERDHWVAIRGRSSSAQFERLCMAARESQDRAGVRSWGLGVPAEPSQWLTAPVLFPDPLSMLAGLWLLAAVVGQLLERQRGRAELAAVLAAGALIPALAWSAMAGDAARPWLGGAALVSAVVAAAVTALPGLQQRFWLPVASGPLELPLWTVLGWWLLIRLLAVALFGIERSALAAEMLAVVVGAGAGLVVRLGLAGAVQRLVEQGKAQLRAAAEPVGPAVVPAPNYGGPPPPRGPHVPDPEKTIHEIEETMDSAGDEALAALFGEDPAPVAVPVSVPISVAPTAGKPTPAPSASAAPLPSAAMALPFGGFGESNPPASAALDLDDLLGAGPVPVAPSQPAAPLAFGPKALAVPRRADSEQTAMVATEPSAVWVAPRPAEATRAYAGSTGEAIRAAIDLAEGSAQPPPAVRLSHAVQRDASGNLQWLLEGQWESLATDLIQGVAVGLVEHRNWPDAQPEIWIDVILDRGGPGRRAEAVRVHLSREALQQFAPGSSGAAAFGALAEELAGAGALRLPQRPVWPGPPWPRYPTAAEFVAMWQRELG